MKEDPDPKPLFTRTHYIRGSEGGLASIFLVGHNGLKIKSLVGEPSPGGGGGSTPSVDGFLPRPFLGPGAGRLDDGGHDPVRVDPLRLRLEVEDEPVAEGGDGELFQVLEARVVPPEEESP